MTFDDVLDDGAPHSINDDGELGRRETFKPGMESGLDLFIGLFIGLFQLRCRGGILVDLADGAGGVECFGIVMLLTILHDMGGVRMGERHS